MPFCHCLVAHATNCVFNHSIFCFVLKPRYLKENNPTFNMASTDPQFCFKLVAFLTFFQLVTKFPAFLRCTGSSSSSLKSATGPKSMPRDSTSFLFLYITFKCYNPVCIHLDLVRSIFFSVRKVGLKLSTL